MGKMKQLAIEMAEAEMYLPHYYPEEPPSIRETSDILCPNCMEDHLIQLNQVELGCENCGQQFDLVGKNTVVFK